VKRPESGFLKFSVERRATGDYKHIALGDATKLITQEWKDLSESDKKVCHLLSV
jgi:hypothetical protein